MNEFHRNRGFSIVGFLIFLLIAAGLIGYWYQDHQKKEKIKEAQKFVTEPVHRGHISQKVNASGMIYPKKIVEVGAQVSGEISKLLVEVGDSVEEGQLIAEIDADTQENAKQTAEAQLQSQKASLQRARAELEKAEKAFKRAQNLYSKGAGTQEEVEAAKASLVSAQNSVTEGESSVRQKEIDIRDKEVNLEYTKVKAPINGRVLAVPVEEGQTINSVQSAPTLITLGQIDVMTIKAEIAEADVSSVRAGMPVVLTLLGKNTRTFNATLKSIDPAPKEIADNGQLTSSTAIYYYGHIDVENPDEILRYGMTATVSIEIASSDDALTVPLTAIKNLREGQKGVLVFENGKPQMRRIETGIEDGVRIEVMSGLKEGEAVIVSGGEDIRGERGEGRREGRGERGGNRGPGGNRRGPPGGPF
ncbi:MAG: efflux RND transporter periplasmic adaptor subunit [Cardiobacteriaceae bacterium]|nr:efflux RND transporter periplasmic adaptor subunit [Cardiobacteriaceae bacterium]